MIYRRVFVEAVGYELAPVVETTEAIETRLSIVLKKLGLAPGYIEAMTGIRERRYWAADQSLPQVAALAIGDALAQTNIDSRMLESLCYASVCRSGFEPATACEVAQTLLRTGQPVHPCAWVYDLSNACLGGLNALVELANRIELGQIRCGAVVCCESAQAINQIEQARLLERGDLETFRNTFATLTGGSGAAAIILSDGSFGQAQHRLLGGVARSDPRFADICQWGVVREPCDTEPSGFRWSERMRTDSVAVLENGLVLGRQTFADFLGAMDWQVADIKKTVCHQIGKAHRDRALPLFGLDPARDFETFSYLGNTGSAAVPISLGLAEQRGFLAEGDKVALLGIGSGLNCVMLGVQW
jgi:3-oxoacyl-[acyl-carrier-protein] synthase-3